MNSFRQYVQTLRQFLRRSFGDRPFLSAFVATLGVLAIAFQFLAIGLVAGFLLYVESGNAINLGFAALDPRHQTTLVLAGFAFAVTLLLQAFCLLHAQIMTVRIACDYQDKIVESILRNLTGSNDLGSLRALATRAGQTVPNYILRVVTSNSAAANRGIRIVFSLFPQIVTILIGGTILAYLMPMMTGLVVLVAMIFAGVQKSLSLHAANWNLMLDKAHPHATAKIRQATLSRLQFGSYIGGTSESLMEQEEVLASSTARRGSLEVIYQSQFYGSLAFLLSMLMFLVYIGLDSPHLGDGWSPIVLYALVLIRVFMALRSLQMGVTNFNRFYRKIGQAVLLEDILLKEQRPLRLSPDLPRKQICCKALSMPDTPITLGFVHRLAELFQSCPDSYLWLSQERPSNDPVFLEDLDELDRKNRASMCATGAVDLSRLTPGVKEAWESRAEKSLAGINWSEMSPNQRADIFLMLALASEQLLIIVDNLTARRWFSNATCRKALEQSELLERLLILVDDTTLKLLKGEEVLFMQLAEDGVTLMPGYGKVSGDPAVAGYCDESEPSTLGEGYQ